MMNPIILLKREIKDFLEFHKFKSSDTANRVESIDAETLYQFAQDNIIPIQKKTEILSLINYLNEIAPENYCEIGLANGGTCFLITNLVPSLKNIYGIDLHIFNKRLQKYYAGKPKHLAFKTGSSTDHRIIKWLDEELGGKELDILFIDGDHSYQGVKQDFENYHQFVRENGLIIFHDIVLDHTQKYGVKTNRDTGGVPQFYKEIAAHFSTREFIEDEDQDGFGIGVVSYNSESFKNWLAVYNQS